MSFIKFFLVTSVVLLYTSPLFSLEDVLINSQVEKRVDEEKIIHSIENALSRHDSEEIRHLMLNEFGKKYIHQKLGTYLQHINSLNLDKMETMLEAGVRPESPNPYSEAIKTEDVKVCSLLHRFGINPSKRDQKIFRSKFSLEDMTLQSPPTFVQKLSKVTLNQKMHQEIDQEIDEIYRELSFKLQSAKNESIKKGKPFLILLGEQHKSLNSYLYELIILHLAKEYNIDTLYTEAFSAKTYSRMHWSWSHSTVVEKVAGQLNIRKKTVDLFACHQVAEEDAFEDCVGVARVSFPSGYDWVSPKGVEDRNKVMANEIINSSNNKDKIAIVGAGHLIGLNKLLSTHFHVIVISVTKLKSSHKKAESSSYAKEAIEYAKSVELPSCKFISKPGLFLSSNVYVDKAKEGYIRYKMVNAKKQTR